MAEFAGRFMRFYNETLREWLDMPWRAMLALTRAMGPIAAGEAAACFGGGADVGEADTNRRVIETDDPREFFGVLNGIKIGGQA